MTLPTNQLAQKVEELDNWTASIQRNPEPAMRYAQSQVKPVKIHVDHANIHRTLLKNLEDNIAGLFDYGNIIKSQIQFHLDQIAVHNSQIAALNKEINDLTMMSNEMALQQDENIDTTTEVEPNEASAKSLEVIENAVSHVKKHSKERFITRHVKSLGAWISGAKEAKVTTDRARFEKYRLGRISLSRDLVTSNLTMKHHT